MAVEMYCDHCGEPIEERAAKFMGLDGRGGVSEFQYHQGECFASAIEALQNRADQAHAEEKDEYHWVLVKRHKAEAVELSEMDMEEYRERYVKSDLPAFAYITRTGLIRSGVWRLEHLAGMTEAEVRLIPGVGEKTIARLKLELHGRGMDFLAEEVAA